MASGLMSIKGQQKVIVQPGGGGATGNAVASQVLYGCTFSNSVSTDLIGTMPNNGKINKTLDATSNSYMIPIGYHDGTGKVSVVTETKTVELSTEVQTIRATEGKLIESFTVPAITGTASTADVKAGQTFSSASGVNVAGTMPVITSGKNYIPETGEYTIPKGYHNGTGIVAVQDKTLNLELSTSSKTYTGIYTSVVIPAISGNANISDVIKGKTFCSANGIDLEGTIENYTGTTTISADGDNLTISTESSVKYASIPIPSDGYYSTTSKIKFKVVDVTAGLSTSDQTINRDCLIDTITIPAVPGDATVNDVIKGKTFSSKNGIMISGNIDDYTDEVKAANDTIQSLTTGGNLYIGISNPGYYSETSEVYIHTVKQTVSPSTTEQIVGGLDENNNLISSVTIEPVTGTAVQKNVLRGKTFSSEAGINISGTMTDFSSTTKVVMNTTSDNSKMYFGIPEPGYYNTNSKLSVAKSSLVQMMELTNVYLYALHDIHIHNYNKFPKLTVSFSDAIYAGSFGFASSKLASSCINVKDGEGNIIQSVTYQQPATIDISSYGETGVFLNVNDEQNEFNGDFFIAVLDIVRLSF